MGGLTYPGVYVEEVRFGVSTITGVPTSTTGFVGDAAEGQPARRIRSFADYERAFDGASALGDALRLFFAGGGSDAWVAAEVQALDAAEDLGLLCLPGATDVDALAVALAYADRRRAFLIVDPPGVDPADTLALVRKLRETGSANAAVYFPPVRIDDPPRTCAPSGAVAAVYARTDAARGVWKAPAGTDAVLPGVGELERTLTEAEAAELNDAGVSTIRTFPTRGIRVWGSRTIAEPSSEWKYVPVRRTALYLEESLYRGLQWAVFEPNDEPLWAKVRSQVGVFLHGLFQAGAFQGQAPGRGYFVRCGDDTMTQDDVADGRLKVLVGIAAVKPAEFVLLRIEKQLARVATESLQATSEPAQRLRLGHRPLRSEGVFLQVGGTTWTEVEDFDAAARDAAVYVLDRESGRVTFGDGVRGAVPERGVKMQATYRYGTGSRAAEEE